MRRLANGGGDTTSGGGGRLPMIRRLEAGLGNTDGTVNDIILKTEVVGAIRSKTAGLRMHKHGCRHAWLAALHDDAAVI